MASLTDLSWIRLSFYFWIGSVFGGISRLFFEEAGIEYLDSRIDPREWDEYKFKFTNAKLSPFGRVPIVELNGRFYTQTLPILRYFSKRLNRYNGKTVDEEYFLDQVADLYNDWRFEWAAVEQKVLLDVPQVGQLGS
ncbi:hypothetical protein HK102_007749, partial [Quaeritorhiza haematococci]